MTHLKYVSTNVNTLEEDGEAGGWNWRREHTHSSPHSEVQAHERALGRVAASWPAALLIAEPRPLHRAASSLIPRLIIESPRLAFLMLCFSHFGTEETKAKKMFSEHHINFILYWFTLFSLSLFLRKMECGLVLRFVSINSLSLFSVRSLNPRKVHERCYVYCFMLFCTLSPSFPFWIMFCWSYFKLWNGLLPRVHDIMHF